MSRPWAPTLVQCRHGKPLRDAKPEPYVCVCCGAEHRTDGQLCLACRTIPPLKSGLR